MPDTIYSFYIFDGRPPNYRSFKTIFYLIFSNFTYLSIHISKKPNLLWDHNNKENYYDGYNNSLWYGYIFIAYGT